MFSNIYNWLLKIPCLGRLKKDTDRKRKCKMVLKKATDSQTKWENDLKKAKTTKDYESFLLSDLDTRVKAKLIYQISLQKGLPNYLFGDQNEIEHLVTLLENQGQCRIARILLFFQYHHQPPDPGVLNWCQELIRHERACDLILQSLGFHQSAHQALNEDRNSDTHRRLASALEDARDSHEELKSIYLEVKDAIAIHLANMPRGQFRRAFLTWRNEPYWHLCDGLRQDCIARGGCCARECGCCEKPRAIGKYSSLGHCTLLCACCSQTKGLFNMSTNAKFHVDPWEEIQKVNVVDQTDMYSRRAYRAYIWGVDILNEIEDCERPEYWNFL